MRVKRILQMHVASPNVPARASSRGQKRPRNRRRQGNRVSIEQDWSRIQAQHLPHPLARPLVLSGTGRRAVADRRMPVGKRVFDVALSLILLIPLGVVMALVAVVLLVAQGRPVLFVQWRMCSPTRAFPLIKFRTMIEADTEFGVTGADQHWRITPLGHFLRRSRLDELPQLFNILRGHMSFVGPRPPMPELVQAAPEVFARVLRSRPGVTGLATLIYHRHEYRILHNCKTAQETRATYLRRCLPAKARIDLIYQQYRTLGLDLWIIVSTLYSVVLRPERPFRRSYRLRRGAKGSRS